jgi:hypothetical protein
MSVFIECNLKELYFLKAFAMIESGIDDNAIGSKGERSRYQIMPFVWKHFCPWLDIKEHGTNPYIASEVAYNILENIIEYYKHYTGNNPTWHDTYVMWNRGPAYYRGKSFNFSSLTLRDREKAVRFNKLIIIYEGKN